MIMSFVKVSENLEEIVTFHETAEKVNKTSILVQILVIKTTTKYQS